MFKYRAKNLKGEWVKGSKLEIANSVFIVPDNTKWVKILDRSHIHCDSIVEIDPSTLGVCWGMKDKNGKEVYTGMFIKSEALQNIKGKTSCSGTYWVPQLFKICFIKNAFIGVNQDKEIQYCGHVFRGGCVIDIPDVIEIIEEKPND